MNQHNRKFLFIISIVLQGAIFLQGQPWHRNTFPGKGYYDNGYSAGAGWDHSEANQKIAVSPLNPNFRAFVDDEWSALMSTDGIHFEPIHMPHIGGGHSKIQDIAFSKYIDSTVYILIGHDHWKSLSTDVSPVGLWRSPDLGLSWEQIYHLPVGAYETIQDYPEGTHILEDPYPSRGNHIYFGSTSHGIVRTVDGGSTWENVAPSLANRRIKMIEAGTTENSETILYAIAGKKLPVHQLGETIPIDEYAPADFSEQWRFENSLAGINGSILEGTISGWTESSAEGAYAASFGGCPSLLAIKNMHYSGSYTDLTIATWVKTDSGENQVIASFDQDAYWQLEVNKSGSDTGQIAWTVNNSIGVKFELVSASRIDDGDWHHVSCVWDKGKISIFIDGELEAYEWGGVTSYGNGSTRYGYLGKASTSETFGDGLTGQGGCFLGQLDDLRIYNNRGFNIHHARGLYLLEEKKNPVPRGSLWRIKVNTSGEVAEIKRLHQGVDDFYSIELNPANPANGWIIRKSRPTRHPFGGREVYKFSDWGETLLKTDIEEGISVGIKRILVNPADSNHVVIRCGGAFVSALRYSLDGGNSWQGTERRVENGHIPSLQSWTARNHHTYGLGLPADAGGQGRASDVTFVPGNPNEILWICTNHLMRSADRGATFTSFGSGGSNKDLGQFAVAPGNPDHWATTAFEYGFPVTTNGGLYWKGSSHSNNQLLSDLSELAEGGNNWTFSRTGTGIAFHPYDASQIIATYTKTGLIIRSLDGGKTWSYTGTQNSLNESANVFWCRSDVQRIYAGTKRSSDGGFTWEDIGKSVVAVSDANANLLIGVSGIQKAMNGSSLNMYVSVDGGDTWKALSAPAKEQVPGTSDRWLVVATRRIWSLTAMDLVAIDPSPEYDPEVDPENRIRFLLAGRSGIYEYNATHSDGSGSATNWMVRNEGLEPNRHYTNIDPVPWMGFVIFDPRPGYENIVYASKTNDWQTLDDWDGEKNRNHSYTGGDNFEPFYISQDGGLSWEKLHGENFPHAPKSAMVHSLEVDSYGRFFAATCEGIYHISMDGLASTLPSDRFRVEFNVKDEASGNPVPGCKLEFDSLVVFTNEKGNVGIDGMARGVYSLEATANNYIPVFVSGINIVSDTSLEISMNSKYFHQVSVKVVDRSSGEPVIRAQVKDGYLSKVTSTSGEVNFDMVEQGHWNFSIEHADYFTMYDSVQVVSDTLLVASLTSTRANVNFLVKDQNGIMEEVPVTLDGSTLLTNFAGSLTFPDKPARKEYSYRIQVPSYHIIEDSFYLEIDTTITILMDPLNGIGSNAMESIRVYPNPASDWLYVDSGSSQIHLKLLSVDGKLIMEKILKHESAELDISILPEGYYFLQLHTLYVCKNVNLVILRK